MHPFSLSLSRTQTPTFLLAGQSNGFFRNAAGMSRRQNENTFVTYITVNAPIARTVLTEIPRGEDTYIHETAVANTKKTIGPASGQQYQEFVYVTTHTVRRKREGEKEKYAL